MENKIAQVLEVLVHITNQHRKTGIISGILELRVQSPSHWVISHQLDVKDHPSSKPVLALLSSSSHLPFA